MHLNELKIARRCVDGEGMKKAGTDVMSARVTGSRVRWVVVVCRKHTHSRMLLQASAFPSFCFSASPFSLCSFALKQQQWNRASCL
jgi:hypothetical protein